MWCKKKKTSLPLSVSTIGEILSANVCNRAHPPHLIMAGDMKEKKQQTFLSYLN